MLQRIFEFWSLREPHLVWVLMGSILLGAAAGVLGCFALVRRRALAGDVLAHAALPGVTGAFALTLSRDPAIILLGAVVSCGIGYAIVEILIHRFDVREDSALAMTLSFFFGLGVFHLSALQKLPHAAQAGLDKLLFGQAASLVRRDVEVLGGIALMLVVFVAICFRQLKIIAFDRSFARGAGMRVLFFECALALAFVLATVIGLQLVGVVLMAAVLLTPAASARFWTDRLSRMVMVSGLFGALAGALGAQISYIAPRMPTGPWMVVMLGVIFAVSCLGAPGRGMIARALRTREARARVLRENILRSLFKLDEEANLRSGRHTMADLLRVRPLASDSLARGLDELVQSAHVEEHEGAYRLTDAGAAEAARITRLHRLWELYLTQHVGLAPDHVHANAEEIEHVLTAELGARLEKEVETRLGDPHGRALPEREGRS